MTPEFKTELQKLIDEAANKSVNRNMLELHEADSRVRHFKAGCEFIMPVLMMAIGQRDDYISRIGSMHEVRIDNKDLLNLLRGS